MIKNYDKNDKKDNYIDDFVKFIDDSKPDIILWWFLDVEFKIFTKIKTTFPNIYYILYNSDDPLNLNIHFMKKCTIFNCASNSCKGTLSKYTLVSGVKDLVFNPFGYNPELFYPIPDNELPLIENIEKYTCDISIYSDIMFNVNNYTKQYIQQTELIENIIQYCNTHKYIFKIFGHPNFKNHYPDNYCGSVSYHELNNVYNFSKININTHSRYDQELYFNMNDMRILGSGGLLFVDKVKNFNNLLQDKCIFIDKTNYLKQITDILENNDSNINTQGHLFSKNYTWAKWCENFHIQISKHFFDKIEYKLTYNIKDEQLWDYWLKCGLKQKHICYSISVPDHFDYESYILDNNLNIKTPKYAYIHWYQHAKNNIYIDNKTNHSDLDIDSLNIHTEDWFRLNHIFAKIYKGENIDINLIELFTIYKENPTLNINKALEIYFSLC